MLSNILAVAAIATAASAQSNQQPVGQSGWQQIAFADEFNQGDAYTTNWGTDLGGWTGTAPGVFDSSLIQMKNGRLQLRSQWRGASLNVAGLGLDEGCDCGFENMATSMVVSKQQFKQGYIEVRAKAYKSTLLNSIWLQGETSEVNIAEFITEGSKKGSSSNFHCWASDSDGSGIDEEPQAGAHSLTTWTTVGVDWQADKITFYIDGKVVRTLAKSRFAQDHPECMAEPMNLVLSTETDTDASLYTEDIGTKVFNLDYVRYWDARAPVTTAAPTGACGGGDDLAKYGAPAQDIQGKYLAGTGVYGTNDQYADAAKASAAGCAAVCSAAAHNAACAGFSFNTDKDYPCTLYTDRGLVSTRAGSGFALYTKQPCTPDTGGGGGGTVASGLKTCDELKADGFAFGSRNVFPGFEGVCVHKFKPYANCKAMGDASLEVTHDGAEGQCNAIGARLCTSQELKGNVFKMAGCNFAQRRHHHVSDKGTCYDGQSFMLSLGHNNPKKPDQCVWKDRKAHFRCCGGPVAKPANAGQAATQDRAVGGALVQASGGDEGEGGGGGGGGGGGDDIVGIALGMGSVLVIAGIAVGVALNSRQNKAIAALGLGKDSRAAEAGRRASFADCVDAVSQQGSVGVGSLDASTDGPTDAPGPAGTEQPVEFEENGFVLADEGNSLRIKSVRRGNPAFLGSVYIESEAVGNGSMEQDSCM